MQLTKRERPKIIDSESEVVVTGCGKLYITVGFDGEEDIPIEVRAILGKAGGCSNCYLEALSRAVSLGLQYGIPPEEFVRELKGHNCPSPHMWPESERILSCPDGIAKVLDGYSKAGRS